MPNLTTLNYSRSVQKTWKDQTKINTTYSVCLPTFQIDSITVRDTTGTTPEPVQAPERDLK